MTKRKTDIEVREVEVYFLVCPFRMPLSFGGRTITEATCARVRVTVADAAGRTAQGWGETPLSAQWAWPSSLAYDTREGAMKDLCVRLAETWASSGIAGHPIEIGHAVVEDLLPRRLAELSRSLPEPMPLLGSLVCCSPFDLATHDAYGVLHNVPTYETYKPPYLTTDLSHFLEADDEKVSFAGKFPADFLVPPPSRLAVWHLAGAKDPLEAGEIAHPLHDGHPMALRDWIRRDGLKCLKVKLHGDDAAWDYDRLVRVGELSREEGVEGLSADLNGQAPDVEYVNGILDRLAKEHPEVHRMLLYIEQPFEADLTARRIDVRSISARKPLLVDESADSWRHVRLARRLGWSGVALKTCKTQTGALLSLCWAKAHGMPLMVQDLTNPMLAQVTHCLLAAHAGTIRGVECNCMQYIPEASAVEARVHTGLYQRRGGVVDLSTIRGPGMGYRVAEIGRKLPSPAAHAQAGK